MIVWGTIIAVSGKSVIIGYCAVIVPLFFANRGPPRGSHGFDQVVRDRTAVCDGSVCGWLWFYVHQLKNTVRIVR